MGKKIGKTNGLLETWIDGRKTSFQVNLKKQKSFSFWLQGHGSRIEDFVQPYLSKLSTFRRFLEATYSTPNPMKHREWNILISML